MTFKNTILEEIDKTDKETKPVADAGFVGAVESSEDNKDNQDEVIKEREKETKFMEKLVLSEDLDLEESEDLEEKFNPLTLKKFGLVRDPENDFTDDGARFTAYLYKDTVPVTYTRYNGDVFLTIAFHHLDDINYNEYGKFPSYKDHDKYNGVPEDSVDPEDLIRILEQAKKDIEDFRGSVQKPDMEEFKKSIEKQKNYWKEVLNKAKAFLKDNFDAIIECGGKKDCSYYLQQALQYYNSILNNYNKYANYQFDTVSDTYIRNALSPEGQTSLEKQTADPDSEWYLNQVKEYIQRLIKKGTAVKESLNLKEFNYHGWQEDDKEMTRILDKCLEYIWDQVYNYAGEEEFLQFALDDLGMDLGQIKHYFNYEPDKELLDEFGFYPEDEHDLREANDRYPYDTLSGESFKRDNLSKFKDSITIEFPAFNVKYDVEPGVQYETPDKFNKNSLTKLEVSSGENRKIEKLFANTIKNFLTKESYPNHYVGGSVLVGIPNFITIYENQNESLKEDYVGDGLFENVYSDLIRIPRVRDNIYTSWNKDESKVTIKVDVSNPLIDINKIYDVIDDYDGVEVDESNEGFIVLTMDTGTSIKAHKDGPKDLFTEIYDQLTMSGTAIPSSTGTPKANIGAGYSYEDQISVKDDCKGIVVTVDPRHVEDEKGYLNSLEPAKEVAAKYKDLGVTVEESERVLSNNPKVVAQVLTIKIENPDMPAPGRDDRLGFKKKKPESKELNEATVSCDFSRYEPWGPAVDTYKKIKEAGKLDELESLIDELYNGSIDETNLNDLLAYEEDWVLETLGIDNDAD